MTTYRLGAFAFVVLIISGLMASSASAALTFELARWLVDGATVSAELLVESSGTFLFENTKLGTHIVCSGLLDGTIGPESLDLVTELLNLAGEKVTELNGLSMLCLGLGTCVEEEDAEFWPLKLPWLTEVALDVETGLFYELLFGAAYHLLCLVLGIAAEQECTYPEGAETEVVNKAGGVEANGAQTPNGKCGSEEAVGLVESEPGNLTTSPEGTVSVSL